MNIRGIAFLAGNIIICTFATIWLPLSERLIFFLIFSIYSVISFDVWSYIYDTTTINKIPIKDSAPIFIRAVKYYKTYASSSFMDYIVIFLYCIVIMLITLGMKKSYVYIKGRLG